MQIGGIDANQIVSDLMSVERIPLQALETRQDAAELASRALGGIRTNVESIRLASAKLAGPDAFSNFAAKSSGSAATATSSTKASPGSLSFTVTQLAAAHGLRSIGTVATADTRITDATTISFATGDSAAIGVAALRGTGGLAAGGQNIAVTQASSAASKTGTVLPPSTTFGNETVDLDVDGVAVSISFAAGTYTAQDIADTVQAGLVAAGADASASLDGDGRLTIATGGEGSSNTLRAVGGSLARIGMSADATAIVGSDAIVEVGDTVTVLDDLAPGATVTIATADGDIELDLAAAGLRTGSLDVTTVDVGGGTLSEVAAAVNASSAGVSGAAIRVADGQWRLQLTSRTTGEDGRIVVDDSLLGDIGGLVASSEARNALITIGDGPGAYTVESSSNTFSDVMSGTSITVSELTTDPVTVSVTRDDSAVTDQVRQLVEAMNTALSGIKVQTRYGVDGGGNGALAGNGAMRGLADQLRASLSRPVDGVSGFVGADVGIQVNRDGTFSFNSAKFATALADDPDQVARFFGRDATVPTGVTFLGADASTTTGSYAIDVTTAATRATTSRLFDGGAATSTRIGVRVGDTTVEIDVTAGRTSAQIVDTLNAAFAQRGLAIEAAADAGGLVLTSDGWGVDGNFDLNLDVGGAGTWDDVDGVDVAGTIDGVEATGLGRTLSLGRLADSAAAGLSVQVDGGLSGLLGPVAYQPGIGARVAEATTRMLADGGSLESATSAQDRRIDDFNDQIESFEDRLEKREVTLRRQWSSLQTLLEGLQQRGNYISSQLASLPQLN